MSRERHPISRLVRLGLDDRGHLQPREDGQGRSAWVRPEWQLLRKLEAKPGMAKRSLRQMPRGADGLLEAVANVLASRLAGRLCHAWRSGRVRQPRPWDPIPVAVMVAWQSEEACFGQDFRLPWDAEGLGCLLHRPRIDRLVAFDSTPTRALLHELQLWHGLGYAPAPLAAPSN